MLALARWQSAVILLDWTLSMVGKMWTHLSVNCTSQEYCASLPKDRDL